MKQEEIKLIKRKKYAGDILTALIKNLEFDLKHAIDFVNDLPDVDEHENTKKGAWVYLDGEFGYGDYKCTHCRKIERISDGRENYNFCPNCGADMRE